MAETIAPRYFRLFHPDNGGDVLWEDIGDPLELTNGEPTGGEGLVVKWKEPDDTTAQKKFYKGHDIFIDMSGVPTAQEVAKIPDDQLLACCSMAAILAGEVHPGTKEFLTQIASDQNNKNFQSVIAKDIKIKSVTKVDAGQLQQGQQEGFFFDIEFQQSGQSSDVKTVRSDIVNISKYSQRANSYQISACCAAAAVVAEFGVNPALGSEGSQIRDDIVSFLKDRNFYA